MSNPSINTLTVFRAADGRTFLTSDEVVTYDAMLEEAARIMAPLAFVPFGDEAFSAGKTYVQQDATNVAACHHQLAKVTAEVLDLDSTQLAKLMTGHPSNARAMIGERGYLAPLHNAWYRLCCIHYASGREFGAPQYARQAGKVAMMVLEVTVLSVAA